MDLVFLGTGAGIPSPTRNVTSIVLRMPQERQSIWMFDCGEGTQQQILKYPVKLHQLEKLFVTHMHGDHVFGIPGLLTSRSSQGAVSPLTVYGPEGIKAFIQTAMETSFSHLGYDLDVHEITTSGIVTEDHHAIVTADFLQHNVPCLGYRVEERPQLGSLQADRLKELGLKPGPEYGLLKQGHNVTLPDGRTILSKDVVSPPHPGQVVTILGDTSYTETSIALANKANVLVHESTFGDEAAQLAAKYMHATASDAGKVANQAKVKHLILTHISQRYDSKTVSMLKSQAEQNFPHVTIAADGLIVPVAQKP
ncbi:ribonuclease Z [Alicyclobacillus sp. SO9]|uniref:ribonuclease Z n=1 Tax=Alicyclobacillus sp. SO9 TaxID=2665646 RepID=UPI0018E81768|nr:ribonuclease Z [Alicyclobacillus sp. SO9]QQE80275.1 ribonuclease Z [Alicyclobacillus sp. SO9]